VNKVQGVYKSKIQNKINNTRFSITDKNLVHTGRNLLVQDMISLLYFINFVLTISFF